MTDPNASLHLLAAELQAVRAERDRLRRQEKATLNLARDAKEARAQAEAARKALAETNAELARAKVAAEEAAWISAGQALLAGTLLGRREVSARAAEVLHALAGYLAADVGLLYLTDERGALRAAAGFGVDPEQACPRPLSRGEGLPGRAMLSAEVLQVTDLPAGYLQVLSGLGATDPASLLLVPLWSGEVAVGLVELGALRRFEARDLELTRRSAGTVAVTLQADQVRERVAELLSESQAQSEELERQAEELRTTNDALRVRQAEVEASRVQLEQASRYKSEFLANMSHELRTPLNAILLLSYDLAQNRHGRLGADDLNAIQIMEESGRTLLKLIEDVLDLSKVEAGKIALQLGAVDLRALVASGVRSVERQGRERGLDIVVAVADTVPEALETDALRLGQVLRNLLSNAIKFTSEGRISVTAVADPEWVTLKVADTGIGIAPEKQAVVFETFQQADASTSRRYGGTGLGLAISKQLVELLGGSIGLESEPGVGTTFTVRLPCRSVATHPPPVVDVEVEDAAGRTLLVVEDDPAFGAYVARHGASRGFDVVVAATGAEGVRQARELRPDAIVLDLRLPDMSGTEVLGQLQDDLRTWGIPVYVVSAHPNKEEALSSGAVAFESKPIRPETLDSILAEVVRSASGSSQRLLLVQGDDRAREETHELLMSAGARVEAVRSLAEASERVRHGTFDGVLFVVDAATRVDELEVFIAGSEHLPPVLVGAGRALSEDETARLDRLPHTVLLKAHQSRDALLAEISLFLHRIADRRPISRRPEPATRELAGRVLIAEDDMRTAYALGRLLAEAGLEIDIVENGADALERLGTAPRPAFDLVLMDVMMPELDGLEATKRLRQRWSSEELPVIALTAKAMESDRVAAMAAGFTDYMTKPVVVPELIALLERFLQ